MSSHIYLFAALYCTIQIDSKQLHINKTGR